MATYLVLERPSQCSLAGLCQTHRTPTPTQSPTTAGCLPAPQPHSAPKPPRGPQMERRREGCQQHEGMWWAVTSHGLPAYVRTSNSQAVTTASPGTAGGWKRGSQSHRKALARVLPLSPAGCPRASRPCVSWVWGEATGDPWFHQGLWPRWVNSTGPGKDAWAPGRFLLKAGGTKEDGGAQEGEALAQQERPPGLEAWRRPAFGKEAGFSAKKEGFLASPARLRVVCLGRRRRHHAPPRGL